MTAQPMTDAQISWLLQKLTAASPEFAAFAQEYAFLGDHPLADDEAAALSRDLLAALSE